MDGQNQSDAETPLSFRDRLEILRAKNYFPDLHIVVRDLQYAGLH